MDPGPQLAAAVRGDVPHRSIGQGATQPTPAVGRQDRDLDVPAVKGLGEDRAGHEVGTVPDGQPGVRDPAQALQRQQGVLVEGGVRVVLTTPTREERQPGHFPVAL